MTRATVEQRLLARLRAMGLTLPEGACLIRTYAGYWQRKQGSWSWFAQSGDGESLRIGSQSPMTELIRAGLLSVHTDHGGDTHVDIG